MMREAVAAGATGLVGGHLVELLLADPAYSRVTTLVRKPAPASHPKLSQRVVDFDRLAATPDFPAAQDVFCCLGTTIKKAGSQDAFYRVDFTYVLELARTASRHGARQFLLVTALGADPKSRIFYNRVKGETEQAVNQVPFDAIQVFRPSLLLGERAERRAGERAATLLSRVLGFALVGPLRPYRPIAARDVARAMVRVAKEARAGRHLYPSDRIQALAR
ncbi:MAG: oxidoreductase [Gemmatimonadales bacterium]